MNSRQFGGVRVDPVADGRGVKVTIVRKSEQDSASAVDLLRLAVGVDVNVLAFHTSGNLTRNGCIGKTFVDKAPG